MSTIHLTDDLLNAVQQTLEQHDESTRDAGIAIQYLAAMVGFLVARFPADSDAQRRHVLEQLCEFSQHVFEQNTGGQPASSQPSEEAFGIWKPEEH